MPMLKEDELTRISRQVRKLIVEVVHHAKAGHIGGPLSVTDILVVLYNDVMKIDPTRPSWPDRDRLVLSKGHSALALYAVLALKGYFSVEELKTFDKMNTRLQGHPDMSKLPGIDMSTGSLGQGISAAVGMALGANLTGKDFMTYCIIGDGESQEGQVWEAASIAAKYRLDNLVVILDHNKLQQYGWRGDEQNRQDPLDVPEEKWKAFGWNTISIDGHSFSDISKACRRQKQDRPTIVLANTIKGKGVSFMENTYLWHANVPTDEELEKAVTEIMAEGKEKGCMNSIR